MSPLRTAPYKKNCGRSGRIALPSATTPQDREKWDHDQRAPNTGELDRQVVLKNLRQIITAMHAAHDESAYGPLRKVDCHDEQRPGRENGTPGVLYKRLSGTDCVGHSER